MIRYSLDDNTTVVHDNYFCIQSVLCLCCAASSVRNDFLPLTVSALLLLCSSFSCCALLWPLVVTHILYMQCHEEAFVKHFLLLLLKG